MADDVPPAPVPSSPPSEPPAKAPPSPPRQLKSRLSPPPLTPSAPIVSRQTASPAAQERRDFFSDAMREMLAPFTGIIERKIQPILTAIESIPDQAERLTKMDPSRALDQMHTRIAKALPGNVSLPVQKPARVERYLRPPGAMEPGEFEAVCSRCGKCVEACPAEAILLDPNGLVADGFPYIIPSHQPCVVSDDLACMKSCPTGALKLVDRLHIDLGTAKADHELCLRDRGENCTLCLDVCPVMDEDPARCALVASPLTGKIIVHKNICIGCGLCENRCPTEPRAITIIPHIRPVDPIIA